MAASYLLHYLVGLLITILVHKSRRLSVVAYVDMFGRLRAGALCCYERVVNASRYCGMRGNTP